MAKGMLDWPTKKAPKAMPGQIGMLSKQLGLGYGHAGAFRDQMQDTYKPMNVPMAPGMAAGGGSGGAAPGMTAAGPFANLTPQQLAAVRASMGQAMGLPESEWGTLFAAPPPQPSEPAFDIAQFLKTRR